jgi:16S rRNA (uracil1498-N3)-methyltransferase
LARRRFFVDEISGDRAELAGDDARHLARVLRAEVGQRYEISDNHHAYLAEIAEIAAQRVTFRILDPIPEEDATVEIFLLSALIKFDRFEWLIEKATELGVARILPVIAERSEKGLDLAAAKRIERWKKIAREASQQARRVSMPEIMLPEAFDAAVSRTLPHRYFLDEQSGPNSLARILQAQPVGITQDVSAILTGPEGGWTDRERLLAGREGWKPVSLGPRILRAETAAIAALAVLSQAAA